jgi:hypothetical protein
MSTVTVVEGLPEDRRPRGARRERAGDNKMISVEVKFWTNNIAEKQGQIMPRVAREAGVIKVLNNNRHGIKSSAPIPFHSLPDLLKKLEDALIKNAIELIATTRTRKYRRNVEPHMK